MSKYTITLRELIKAGYWIFDDSWTTFDPNHKEELCNKIIRRYYFNEIGAETPDRFRFYINEQLAREMPYYNKLYESELFKLEPLYNYVMDNAGGTSRTLDRGKMFSSASKSDRLKKMADSLNRALTGTGNLTGIHNTVGSETWSETEEYTDNETTDQSTSEETTKKVNFTGKEDTVVKEVMQDINDGTKTTDGTSQTSTSNTRKYSDTPQEDVGSSGTYISGRYLTNYTAETGDSNTTTHSDEELHNQEDKTTDTTKTVDTTSTEDTTQSVTGTLDKTVDTTGDKQTHGQRSTTSKLDDSENTRRTEDEKRFSNGSESNQDYTSSLGDETEAEKEKEDSTLLTKGYTVSQAELLMAYRRSILNIDNLIIESLVTNFMGVF